MRMNSRSKRLTAALAFNRKKLMYASQEKKSVDRSRHLARALETPTALR